MRHCACSYWGKTRESLAPKQTEYRSPTTRLSNLTAPEAADIQFWQFFIKHKRFQTGSQETTSERCLLHARYAGCGLLTPMTILKWKRRNINQVCCPACLGMVRKPFDTTWYVKMGCLRKWFSPNSCLMKIINIHWPENTSNFIKKVVTKPMTATGQRHMATLLGRIWKYSPRANDKHL